jgi:hypothetical protein
MPIHLARLRPAMTIGTFGCVINFQKSSSYVGEKENDDVVR